MTLRHKTFTAVRWLTFSSLLRAVLQLLQLAILARMLSPGDYGLMAMVAVVLGFTGLLADMGGNSAFVQRQQVTDEQRASLYWLNIGVSIAMTLIVMLLTPIIAGALQESSLIPLLLVAANGLWITALGQQARAAAEKQLNFHPLAVLEISSALLGFGVAVFAAWASWGVWALVAGSLTENIAASVGAWWFMSKDSRPRRHFSWVEVRPFMGFSSALVANNLVNYVNAYIDLLLCGRLLGSLQLGLYSVPRNLSLQVAATINPIIARIGFPLIAQVQHDRARVRSIYLQTINMTASVNAPIYVALVYFAPEAVDFMLGSQWKEAAPLLRILAVWGLFRSLGNPVGSLLFGMGKASLALKWNLAMTLLVAPTLWLSLQWGTTGLVVAMACLVVVLFVPGWFVLIKPLCGATLAEYAVSALRPVALATLAVGSGYFTVNDLDGTVMRMGLGALVAAPLYWIVSSFSNREWTTAMKQLLWRDTHPPA